MIDKKVILLIGVLIVAAVVVLALSMANIKFGGGGSTFSALFDSMHERTNHTRELVLPNSYTNGQAITVKDKIISIESTTYVTVFYFLYTGDVWVNETGGTDFTVVEFIGGIHVHNAVFGIEVSGDWHMSYDIDSLITLRTTVAFSGGDLIPQGNWVVVAE